MPTSPPGRISIRRTLYSLRKAAIVAVLPAFALSACHAGPDPHGPDNPQEDSPNTTSQVSTSTSPSTTTSSASDAESQVSHVREVFSSLAPASVFDKFESCSASGINESFQCSGPEIGQFQFFKSSAKAASTTQLLTELRSSRVVEDSGSRVVGWSTLGTTAVITVVDNNKGLVMQQMVSSDQVDPEARIKELGLVKEGDASTLRPHNADKSQRSSAPSEPKS
ncbi:hypothetical protein [Corynebacterium poyangense]|uniref:hypothetical protein n=1 Tax=Corynebacterium poyangense TaxID=2684405 RepID=UPI00165D0270|nr:hypothetical protein [Corynebacterium poyangense]